MVKKDAFVSSYNGKVCVRSQSKRVGCLVGSPLWYEARFQSPVLCNIDSDEM